MIRLPTPQKYQTRLRAIQKVSSKIYLEWFDLVEPVDMTYLPGQTVTINVAPGIVRSMSIASVPTQKQTILLVHDVSPMGPFSQWALNAKVGDTLPLVGPLGMFILDKE